MCTLKLINYLILPQIAHRNASNFCKQYLFLQRVHSCGIWKLDVAMKENVGTERKE